MALTQPPQAATDGQLKQLIRVGSDAVEKAIKDYDLSKDGAQQVHANGDELAEAVHEAVYAAVTGKLNSLTSPEEFKDEEVKSEYGYLSGYKPNGIVQQTNVLRQLFPGVGFANQDLLGQIERGDAKLPKHAEGWFAIPNWVKNPKIFGATYNEAVQVVLDMIKKTRDGKFYNYREGKLGPKYLRQLARTEKLWKKLSEAQGDPDILLVPAQFGLRHRGRSTRRARVVVMYTPGGEYGLGAFATGCMILTHPERLKHYDDLWIDCPGDEYAPVADGDFSGAPYFEFSDKQVGFDAGWLDVAFEFCGSASAFLPQ
jgi:hypothetical protein